MSVFVLKIIACVTMIIDHVAYCFIPAIGDTLIWYEICRSIGRISFPIFCFLIVEGFYHTRNIKKYLARLLIFAVISEPAFDFGFNFYETLGWFEMQNVFFTLFIGLLAVTIVDYLRRQYAANPTIYNFYATITIIASSFAAYLLRSDYSILGVIYILVFYFFRQKKSITCIAMIVVIVCFYVYNAENVAVNLCAIAALIPICLYNGKKGISAKYMFYLIYPLHLVVLGLIRIL